MTHEAGHPLPRVLPLSHHLPDPRRPAIADIVHRNQFFRESVQTQHTTVTVGNTQTERSRELQRIRSVRAGAVTGGVLTIQVQVDGRDMFEDGNRPLSGGTPREPHKTGHYTFPAGATISTIVEADSAASTGPLNVIIETEPFELLPQFPPAELHGADRLQMSKRRAVEFLNAQGVSETTSLRVTGRGDIHNTRVAERIAANAPAPPRAPRPDPFGTRPPPRI